LFTHHALVAVGRRNENPLCLALVFADISDNNTRVLYSTNSTYIME